MTAPRWAAAAIVAALALALVFDIDHPLARFAAGAGPGLLAIFRFVTWFGQGGVVLVPSGLLVLAGLWLRPRLPSLAGPLRRLVRNAGLLFIAVAFAGLANDALKLAFARARPRQWLYGDHLSGFFTGRLGSDFQSFPSGHTATSVAAAIIIAQLFPRFRFAAAAFALLIALSRIVLDAHYASDVIAGAAVGAAAAAITLSWFRRRGWVSQADRTLGSDRPGLTQSRS